MISALGGRKFVFALILITMGFILVITGETTVDSFFNFAELVGGTYVLGNIATKVVAKPERNPQE